MMPTISTQAATPSPAKPMLERVLVAIDYPDDIPEIFAQALDIAERFQAQLQIFHCVRPQPIAIPEIGAFAAYGGVIDSTAIALQEEQFNAQIKEVSQWLQDLASQAQERNIPVLTTQKVGEPNEEICEIAKTWQADLIVIGRRGLSGIREMLLGSVSSYILHHAPCSVMVVQCAS